MDFVFHAVDSKSPGMGSKFMSVELGFQIPTFSWIPEFLSPIWILKTRIPDSTTSRKNFRDFGIRITLYVRGYTKGLQFKVVAATVTKNYTKITIQCLLKVLISALELEVSHALQASFN